MKSFTHWLEDRTGLGSLLRGLLYVEIPGGPRWRYVWGSTLLFTLFIQFVTGIVLWMAYSPSTQTAWESVYYIQHEMQGGWFLRGLHHYTSHLMICLLVIHLFQVVIYKAYQAPREVNFWIGLLLLILVLALSLTGYLLPWDERGLRATGIATSLAGLTPVFGPQIERLAVGGAEFGHHTLTRFFALHAGILPAILIVLVIAHVALFRRRGYTVPAAEASATPASYYWPAQALRDAVACLAVAGLLVVITLWPTESAGPDASLNTRGAHLGAPADMADPMAAARPEWYFLALFQLLKYFPGERVFIASQVIPGVALLLLVLMPLVARFRWGHRFNLAVLGVLALGVLGLTAQAVYHDFNDPEHQAAVSSATEKAHRAVELAQSPQGIPPTGALTLLHADPKLRGPVLFKQHCASCHAYADAEGIGLQPPIDTTAANLYGFGNRAWAAGILDPEQVDGPNFFGTGGHNTESGGEMAQWVLDNVPDLDPEDMHKVALALSAEAQLRYQAAEDAQDAELIEQGRTLLVEEVGCIDCHKFHDDGDLGYGPDLTGWASREWLIGIIRNPEHERFYEYSHDSMPAFNVEGEASPRLTLAEIGLIADWLRRDWYEARTTTTASADSTDEAAEETTSADADEASEEAAKQEQPDEAAATAEPAPADPTAAAEDVDPTLEEDALEEGTSEAPADEAPTAEETVAEETTSPTETSPETISPGDSSEPAAEETEPTESAPPTDG